MIDSAQFCGLKNRTLLKGDINQNTSHCWNRGWVNYGLSSTVPLPVELLQPPPLQLSNTRTRRELECHHGCKKIVSYFAQIYEEPRPDKETFRKAVLNWDNFVIS